MWGLKFNFGRGNVISYHYGLALAWSSLWTVSAVCKLHSVQDAALEMCHFDKIRRAEHSYQGRYGRGEGNWFGREPHFADQTIISQYLRRRAILRVIAEPCEIYQYGSQGIRFEIHCNHFYQTNLNGGAKNIRTQWIDRNACERDGPLWIRGT